MRARTLTVPLVLSLSLGLGVIDVKVNHVETAEQIAHALERAAAVLGEGRVRWIHPDCGLWMLKRSVADRKMHALVQGRDLFLDHHTSKWPDRSAVHAR